MPLVAGQSQGIMPIIYPHDVLRDAKPIYGPHKSGMCSSAYVRTGIRTRREGRLSAACVIRPGKGRHGRERCRWRRGEGAR